MKMKPNFFKLTASVIALSAAINVGMRFLPVSMFTFRTQEAASIDYNSLGNFSANASFHADRAYGDLSAMGNYRDFRQYRSESLMTDQCGNRDKPEILREGGPVDAIFLGSSFTNGIGLHDDETLAAQYSAMTGLPVYNAARINSYSSVYSLTSMLSLAQALHLKPGGSFIFELQSRYGLNVDDLNLNDAKILPLETLCRAKSFSTDKIWYLHNREGLSPLSIFSQNFLKWFQDDKILPNAQRDLVSVHSLKNGEPMLFLNAEIKTYTTARDIDQSVAFFVVFAKALSQYGYGLRVILMPGKYDVYAPLLKELPPESTGTVPYFNGLEARLRDAHIPVIDFLPIFREHAASALASGKTIYWIDDTHWNAEGVGIAAKTLAQAWKSP
jgi:hypothetical protein